LAERAGGSRGTIYEYNPTTSAEREILDLDRIDLVAREWFATPDASRIAVVVGAAASDDMVVRVFDTRQKKWLPDEVGGLRFSYPSWAPDGSGFYYTWSPPQTAGATAGQREAQSEIRFHVIGHASSKDEAIRPPTGLNATVEVPEASPDGRWVQIGRWDATSTTVFLGKARGVRAAPAWVQLTPPGARTSYSLSFGKNALLVRTDEGAPNGRVFRVDPNHPDRSAWTEIVPEHANAALQNVLAVGDYVFCNYLQDAESYYEVHRYDGTLVKRLSAPETGSLNDLTGDVGSPIATVGLASYTQPTQIFTVAPPNFDLKPFPPDEKARSTNDYVAEKIFYTTPDGTRAPIFLVRKRSTPRRENSPLLLEAYGAFGISVVPKYHSGVHVWLERGGIYAEAVVHGGSEYGKDWHQAAMNKRRKKVYDDFIAASEFLIHEGWTSPDRLVIHGVSAGGLLVTVAETERPDLFRAVIADVPITDMIRYPLGHDVGTLWFDEYGSPLKTDELPLLLRYSPYHRVERGTRYPATLILASENDQRLDPMHSRKYVAALEDADPCAPIFLRTEREGGHTGSTKAAGFIEEEADMYTFALEAVHGAFARTSPENRNARDE